MTYVEELDKGCLADSEVESTSTLHSYNDETCILMPSPRIKTKAKQNAAKQFRLVEQVVRMKERFTQRLHTSKNGSKQETVSPPQSSVLQRSAKKLENATDWAEAEHESVKLMAHKIQLTETANQLKGKWKEVGKVVNNLLMWMYIISIVLSFFVFFGPVFWAEDKEIAD